ncbi:uncharacterized mitochondrial protein AtMg00810-like [Lathyrus oleraceus]|uniref:uncharacterized mitochondrial protein AtMg00810-like n=1 Tax=Pisum sativum TaxID=3888 RepID=UPI0021D2B921|nr:uncharacterized mitochondrial protein AtMg00810-like [Pisum sativum]
MQSKFDALIRNKMWDLVPRPCDANLIRCMWIFRHKEISDGSFERYKARLVGDGKSQVAVSRHPDGIFLSQSTYASEIIERVGMAFCKPSTTPVDTKQKLSTSSGTSYEDPSLYRSLVGALQYLTFTRPDISYDVQQVCLHMHAPRTEHMLALKRILCHVQGTLHFGLHLSPSYITKIISYTDADWGGCPNTDVLTSGYCVFLGDNLISWSSKRWLTKCYILMYIDSIQINEKDTISIILQARLRPNGYYVSDASRLVTERIDSLVNSAREVLSN